MALKVRTMGGLPSNENDDVATAENESSSQATTTSQDLLKNLRNIGAQRANARKKNRMPVESYTCIYCGGTSNKKDDQQGAGCGYDWKCPGHQDFGSNYHPEEYPAFSFAYSLNERDCFKKIVEFCKRVKGTAGDTDLEVLNNYHKQLQDAEGVLDVQYYWEEWFSLAVNPVVCQGIASSSGFYTLEMQKRHRLMGVTANVESNSMEDLCKKILSMDIKEIYQAIRDTIKEAVDEYKPKIDMPPGCKLTWFKESSFYGKEEFAEHVIPALPKEDWEYFQFLVESGHYLMHELHAWLCLLEVGSVGTREACRSFLNSIPK